jgi:dienelactone hydrolase
VVASLLLTAAEAAAEERRTPTTPQEFATLRIVHTVPGMDKVRVKRDLVYKTVGGTRLLMDVYSPAGAAGKQPAVVLVHGGPVPASASFKNTGVFVSYGEMLAASGLTAVTFNHRFTAPDAVRDAAGDVQDLVRHVREQADTLGIDQDRLAVWVFSGGGPFLSPFLKDSPPHVRCIVSYYALLDLEALPAEATPGVDAETRRELSAVRHISTSAPAILVARAGRDNEAFNDSIDRFVQQALRGNVALELINHPTGRHAFDILDDDPRSRAVIARTVEFLRAHLLGAEGGGRQRTNR